MAFGAALLGSGCDLTDIPVLDPKGPIALAERDLLLTAVALMLIVIIPVFFMTFLFAWRYRSSNSNARYTPDWSYSVITDVVVWLVPAVIVMVLGTHLWSNTHKLDPYKPIDVSVRPLEVEVVAQDWKWLFIYPEQGIAVVNQLVFPSQTPLSLKLTSDTVMNSFSIPALGGQIYAMAGMQTRLHLLADAPGTFAGRNMQYSGRGFANQHFEAIAVSQEDFDAWVAKVKQSPTTLDAATYRALAAPTIGHPVTYYSAVEPNLFDTIIAKYARGSGHAGQQAAHETHVGEAQDAR
ncbi:MAG: ubiquinol oxidase subunit II [Rhizobiales bacterium]|nr:ubiquinol oxidase subunit II [Hyphomicrobiales bacterium]